MENYLKNLLPNLFSVNLITIAWLVLFNFVELHGIIRNVTELNGVYPNELYLENSTNTYHIKCTVEAKGNTTDYCECPSANIDLKNFICRYSTENFNRSSQNLICSCMKTSPTNCTCVSTDLVITNVSCVYESKQNFIKLGVLLPYTLGNSDLPKIFAGRNYAPAMYLAVEDINNNTYLLQNHKVDLVWGNTQCDLKNTVELTMKMIEEQKVDAIIGGGYEGCLLTAQIAAVKNIPMVSHVSVLTLIFAFCQNFKQ